jgi:zona occludens toxin
MIILITGVPGSGKSLYSIGLIRDYLKEGRTVFCDIDGCTIPGVLPGVDDWRECPDGSVIVYDECQQRFGPDGQGRASNPVISELETHRHRGMDILLITQHPKLLHAHIRRLVGRHYHVFRMYGAQSAKIFTRDGQMDVDKPAYLLQQDHFLWQYPQQDFSLYKSATIHTHKRKLPRWVIRSALGAVAAVAIMSFFLPRALSFMSGDYTGQSGKLPASAQQATVSDQADSFLDLAIAPDTPVHPHALSGVRACIASENRCYCYQDDGFLLEMIVGYCQTILAGMTPRYSWSRAGGSERAAASRTPPDADPASWR